MIGKAYVSTFQFYDNRTRKMRFKNRPVLIVGKADSTDYVVLPISRVTNSANLESNYDVPIEPQNVPLMNLKQRSYIRTHKQTVIHFVELTKEIIDFSKEYPDIYVTVIAKMEDLYKKQLTLPHNTLILEKT